MRTVTKAATSSTFRLPVSGGARLLAEEFVPAGGADPALPTVVLAHGWTVARASWQPVIDELQRHRQVRVAHLGCGVAIGIAVEQHGRHLDALTRQAARKGAHLRELIGARMAARRDHFMPTALLDSQFATLEPPGPDEAPVVVHVGGTPETIVEAILAAVDLAPVAKA